MIIGLQINFGGDGISDQNLEGEKRYSMETKDISIIMESQT